MNKTKTQIADFIQSLPESERLAMQELHNLISKSIPDAPQVMWEGVFWGGSEQKIIGYGDMKYRRSDKKEVNWFIVGLAQQKNYLTIFLNAVEDSTYLAEKYKGVLGKVKIGKSSISFKKVDDINLDKLEEIIKKGYELMSK